MSSFHFAGTVHVRGWVQPIISTSQRESTGDKKKHYTERQRMSKCQLLFTPNSMSFQDDCKGKKNRNLGHMKTNDGKHISNVLIRNCHRQQTTVQCKRVTWKRPKKYAEEVGAHILCNVTAAVWHLDNVYVCATPHPNKRARTGKKCLDHVSDTKWTYYNMPKRNRNWHLRKRMWETESDTVQEGKRQREREEHAVTPILEHLFDLFARELLPSWNLQCVQSIT